MKNFLLNTVILSTIFVSFFALTVKAEAKSTITISGLDVTGAEILVSTTTKFEDIAGTTKEREIKVLLFDSNTPATKIGEKTVTNRSEVSGIGTVLFDSSSGLKPETNYKIRAYIKETTIKTLTDTTELIYNPESFVNVKTGTKNQTNFASTSTTNVVNISGKQIAAGDKYDPVYHLLAPIGTFTEIKTDDIGGYFDKIFLIAIGLCGALAVIMFIIGGIQYMGEESIFGKTKGKEQMTSAILGLLIALGSWALLNTINPDLLGGSGLLISSANIKLEGDTNAPVSINTTDMSGLGITCNKTGGFPVVSTVAKSFNGKMTYSQNIPKGQASSGTVMYDCSGFVNAVLQCSGVDTGTLGINSGTSVIFSNAKAEKVTTLTSTSVNGVELQVGDLIGWRPSDDKDNNGHVMIYLGGGMVADSHSPSNKTGKAYGEFATDKYKTRITYVLRTSTL